MVHVCLHYKGGYTYHTEKRVCIEKKKHKVQNTLKTRASTRSLHKKKKTNSNDNHKDEDGYDSSDDNNRRAPPANSRPLLADMRPPRVIDKTTNRHININSFCKSPESSLEGTPSCTTGSSLTLNEKILLKGIWSRAETGDDNVFKFNSMCILKEWLDHYGVCKSKMVNQVFQRKSFAFSTKMNDCDYDNDVGTLHSYKATYLNTNSDDTSDDDGNDDDYDYLLNVCGCAVTCKFQSIQTTKTGNNDDFKKFLAIGTLRVGLLDYEEALESVAHRDADEEEDEDKRIMNAMASLTPLTEAPSNKGYHAPTLGYPADHRNMFTVGKTAQFANLLQIWRIPTHSAPYLDVLWGAEIIHVFN